MIVSPIRPTYSNCSPTSVAWIRRRPRDSPTSKSGASRPLAALCSSDRLGGGNTVPARFLRTFLDAQPAIEPEAFDLCPLLLAHPGVDRMTDIVHSRRFFERLACPKRMVVLENASHMPIEQPGIDQLEDAVLSFLRELPAARSRTAGR